MRKKSGLTIVEQAIVLVPEEKLASPASLKKQKTSETKQERGSSHNNTIVAADHHKHKNLTIMSKNARSIFCKLHQKSPVR